MRKKVLLILSFLLLIYIVYVSLYIRYPINFNLKTAKLSDRYDLDYTLNYNYFNKLILSRNKERLSYNGILFFQKVEIKHCGNNCFEVITRSLGFIESNKKVFIKNIDENEIMYYYTN